uniref:CDT1 Geminin-binding domain-containing protein n=1 Tax=Ditylenchus dipsaci TaxID=166011 RepID=A0A915EA96_9BILA
MTTGLMVSPKTLTSNTLDPDVIRSFAFALPKKYENLLHLFVSMEKVVSVAHRREMRLTFADVCSNVEKNTKMQWEKHRQAICKSKQGVNFDLVVKPNLKDDIQSYLLREEPTKRMNGWRLTCRKMVFRHHLVVRVKKVHKKFLFQISCLCQSIT